MFYNRAGLLSTRFTQIPAIRLVSTYTAPAIGDSLVLRLSGSGIINKYDRAANDSATNANVAGVVVSVKTAAGGAVDHIVMAPCGEEVPLSIFGNLSTLQALGNTNIAFVSDTGRILVSPGTGTYARRIFRLTQTFASLTAEDLASTYVQIIEEQASQV